MNGAADRGKDLALGFCWWHRWLVLGGHLLLLRYSVWTQMTKSREVMDEGCMALRARISCRRSGRVLVEALADISRNMLLNDGREETRQRCCNSDQEPKQG